MQKIHAVSVRRLCEFSLEKGDLIPAARAAARMREGVRGHQILQEMLPYNWRAEVPVSRNVTLEGVALRVHGRADAVLIGTDEVCVQEIKTTAQNPAAIMKYDYPAHWAQAEIYAWLFCKNEGVDRAQVRLTYARLDGRKKEFHEDYDLETLEERFLACALPYARWVREEEQWQEKSLPTIRSLPFPFDRYRDGQREMAECVYRAMAGGARALIEAPTGIGKTAAALYGALKALGEGRITAIFYLTARTTGRRAAEDALDRMRARGLVLRSAVITAREKCCLLEKADCLGCPYAAGYYDRRRDALKQAMGMERLDAAAIRELALDHELCPFELSLDVSETADVIICDYNYAFDPRVRLKRYFDGKSRAGLLVDEAHNLPDRARDMLSAELSGPQLAEVMEMVRSFEGVESPMYGLMAQLMQALDGADAEMESLSEIPRGPLEAAAFFGEAAGELQPAEPEVARFVLDVQWFCRVAGQFDPEYYRALVLPRDGRLTLRLWCFNPAKHLGKLFARVGGAALFSATLTPLEYYAAQMAADGGEDVLLRLESPFPRENLCVLRLPVSAGYRDRERTAHAVAQVIHAMAAAHPGNYLACFPSYAYLEQIYRHYRMLWPGEHVIRQSASMSERARGEFIQCFRPNPRDSMVAFIVLGGVFAEGVDLPDDRLSGAAIISTGIPQISCERELMRELYDDAAEGGYDAAYVYPGIRRVLQAAGRVIRTETDRGVVLLMDRRYRQEKYRALMPPHWRVVDVKSMSALTKKLKDFWREGEAQEL